MWYYVVLCLVDERGEDEDVMRDKLGRLRLRTELRRGKEGEGSVMKGGVGWQEKPAALCRTMWNYVELCSTMWYYVALCSTM